jgi:hypothetical protein
VEILPRPDRRQAHLGAGHGHPRVSPELISFGRISNYCLAFSVVGQIEERLPDPSRKTRDGSASTKLPCTDKVAFAEAARFLGGHPASPRQNESDSLPLFHLPLQIRPYNRAGTTWALNRPSKIEGFLDAARRAL